MWEVEYVGRRFVRFWKFWWIFVLGPSNSTVCAWHYGLRVLVFVLRDSEQKLQIIVMETVIRFGKIVVTLWRIEFVLFFEKFKSLKWNKELITLDYRLQGCSGCRSSQHHVYFQKTLRRSSGREDDHVLWCGRCQSRLEHRAAGDFHGEHPIKIDISHCHWGPLSAISQFVPALSSL